MLLQCFTFSAGAFSIFVCLLWTASVLMWPCSTCLYCYSVCIWTYLQYVMWQKIKVMHIWSPLSHLPIRTGWRSRDSAASPVPIGGLNPQTTKLQVPPKWKHETLNGAFACLWRWPKNLRKQLQTLNKMQQQTIASCCINDEDFVI